MKSPRGASAIGTLIGFILILFLFGVLWVATGGPSRPISHAGPFLALPSVPGVNMGSSTDDVYIGGAISQPGDSPYAKGVRLSVGHAYESNPALEYVTIDVLPSSGGAITATGWKLESKATGAQSTITGAAQVPNTSQVSLQSPVTVSPGSTLHIGTGRSPVGVSFRENECSGYLGQFQRFSPELAHDCPSPYDEAVRSGVAATSECLNFVSGLSRCETYVEAVPQEAGPACQSFAQNDLTYAGCVSIHRNDPDFYTNTWRIFLNQDRELWANQGEEIRLIDENGILIASVSY